MDQTQKTKLEINLANAHRMASNWVMTVAGTLGTIWFAIPKVQQEAFITHLPIPIWSVPIVLTVIGIAARVWPQLGLTARVAAASSAMAPLDEVDKPK